jgi:hypothetical protein
VQLKPSSSIWPGLGKKRSSEKEETGKQKQQQHHSELVPLCPSLRFDQTGKAMQFVMIRKENAGP